MNEGMTRTCRACAETIADDARRCPHCTAWNDPNRRRMITGLIALAVALVVLVALVRANHQADKRAEERVECLRAARILGLDPGDC